RVAPGRRCAGPLRPDARARPSRPGHWQHRDRTSRRDRGPPVIRPTSPARRRDALDELVDDDATRLARADVDRPGPIATAIALASLLAAGALVALTVAGWWL